MSFQRPIHLKKSSAMWLNEIPEGWEEIRGKRVFSQIRTPKKAGDEQLSATQKYGVVPQSLFMEQEGSRVVLALSGTDNFRHVDKDDFVISLRSFQGGIERCHYEGCVSPAYTILKKSRSIDEGFFSYLLKCDWFIAALQIGITGIREGKNVSYEEFGDIVLPFPKTEEQTAIANFLDRETARIDGLIEKKGQFIELLKEKRAADIVDAISPKMGWRKLPFWAVAKAKSISGCTDEGLLSVYLDRGVIPYSEGGGLVHKPAESLEKYQLVEPGDLVMNNQQAWRGSLGVSIYRGIVSPAYLVLELDQTNLHPTFANYMFRARPYVEKFMLASMSVGDIQRQIKWPHLRIVPVVVPDVDEQERLAAKLDSEGVRINGLITKTERSIELLKEKRSALITAAVTGKIDVRSVA
jgi:type I restriction enzyme S subunit